MRVALIAPPFIPVPPIYYGGTELFIAQLACALQGHGVDVVVYANGQSELPCEIRSLYLEADWPLADPEAGMLKNLNHTLWAIRDATEHADVIHLNDALGVAGSRFVELPVVHTLHHPHTPALSTYYGHYPEVNYVTISSFQQRLESMPRIATVHHGIDLSDYRFEPDKDDYLCFLGRLVPCKGAHLAIEIAHRQGIPLKIAGEIQPQFLDYWETVVEPHVDGRHVEYVGEVNLAAKNELLGRARALLFPICWDEPFGLVMIEAMACGTPVLAFNRGSVPEIVEDGVSGWICTDVEEMGRRASEPAVPPLSCREHVRRQFTVQKMAREYLRLYRAVLGETDGLAHLQVLGAER